MTRAKGVDLGNYSVDEARQMLDLFSGLNVSVVDLTFTDVNGNHDARRFRRAMPIDYLYRRVHSVLADATRHELNVIIRPPVARPAFVQLDDLDVVSVSRLKSVAFLIIATSPRNHQAWLGSAEPIDIEFARRLRKGIGADPSASGATRLAGSFNFKAKYAPEFPRVSVVDASPRLLTTVAEIEALDLVAPELARRLLPTKPQRMHGIVGKKRWPSYLRCLEGAPMNRSGTARDVSLCDFTWCVIALDWGWSLEETTDRLMTLSSKAESEGRRYARRTAERAIAVVGNRTLSSQPTP